MVEVASSNLAGPTTKTPIDTVVTGLWVSWLVNANLQKNRTHLVHTTHGLPTSRSLWVSNRTQNYSAYRQFASKKYTFYAMQQCYKNVHTLIPVFNKLREWVCFQSHSLYRLKQQTLVFGAYWLLLLFYWQLPAYSSSPWFTTGRPTFIVPPQNSRDSTVIFAHGETLQGHDSLYFLLL